MKRPESYHTRQREEVLNYIASLGGEHVTAAHIIEHFAAEKTAIGRTTVYRHLDRLVESGKVRKYTIDGLSGACFQYVTPQADCDEHFHLKCEDCGELFHLQCDALGGVGQHILDEHAFKLNTMKTVLYGKCDTCLHKKEIID